MIYGFDFDNTIIDYQDIFFKVALLEKLVPKSLNKDKNSVKSFLNAKGLENEFTRIQGLVYGEKIQLANPTNGIVKFLLNIKKQSSNKLIIISHKTKYPYIGKKINLRDSARNWIKNKLKSNNEDLFDQENIYFESSIEEKINRIKKLNCQYFFDDLPTIINKLPSDIKSVLYDPNNSFEGCCEKRITNWNEFNEESF